VALNARDQEIDIWIWDLVRTTLTRLTFDAGQDRFPIWSPDGQRIAYSAQSRGDDFNWRLVSRAADGTGTAESLVGSIGQMFPTAFLPDATGILVYGDMADPDDDIALVQLNEPSEMTALLDTTFGEAMPEISPDGRWLAYVSNESGGDEIYVRPFPDVNAGRWQISAGGGTEPLWARNGQELFYRRGGAVISVPIHTDPGFTAGNPELVFEGAYFEGVSAGGRSYDVSIDGERFLMIRAVNDESSAPQIIIVENWLEELERLVPTE
jgi:Tol biopolymer transport system component